MSPSWWTDTAANAPANNPILTDVLTTLKDITPNLVSKQHYGYDPFFNQNLQEEYDFGQNAPGAKLRVTQTQYVTDTGYTNPSAVVSQTAYLRSLPSVVTTKTMAAPSRPRRPLSMIITPPTRITRPWCPAPASLSGAMSSRSAAGSTRPAAQ